MPMMPFKFTATIAPSCYVGVISSLLIPVYLTASRDRRVIQSAIDDYTQYTCLRFEPASSSDRNRVRFQNGNGCSSYVGRVNRIPQEINLANGCRFVSTI